ncbi:hypothetical protein [Qipengyuania citrea]|jgi:predicted flap endonuclease-1-like 5' DNA nuclease|uniref:hypothetical protein n=1 Tax=Qipengyuania citrea TaxID=225971 RepID=UPI000C4AF1AE|nr:hypothetical protein [Erythrobacter sp.]
MSELLQTYWPLIVAALLLGLVIAWYLFNSSRKTRVTSTSRDVLDDGAAPAQRNKALIDSAPAATPMQPAAGVPAGGATTEPAATAPVATPAPTPTPAPASASATPASASAPAGGDDLTRIKGLGPKLSATLHGMGVTTFAQIAAWDDAEIDRVDAQMGRFQGRIRRDDWVGQAAMLAAGDEAGFADRFGKLS